MITSRRNPLAAHLRKLGRDRSYRREQGLFLCEGVKLVSEAVRWGAQIDTLLVEQGRENTVEVPSGVRMAVAPQEVFASASTVDTPQGVMAACTQPNLSPPGAFRGDRYLILDGLQDPGNLGTIWRTADAFGADGLLLLSGCTDPFSPKTVRATMGACFRLPVWEVDWDALTALARGAGLPLYATALREDTEDIRRLDLKRAAVVIGSEGRGVSQEALLRCDRTVKIPMAGRCESLNAAVAASVVLWEMWK